MIIAIELLVVLLGAALVVGFVVARTFNSSPQDVAEKPKRLAVAQNVTAELERLFALFQEGALTSDEYQDLKERLLSGKSPAGAALSADWRLQVEDEIRAGRKIEAIKLYRQATELGLKESKDAVEDMERNLKNGF